MHTNQSTSGGLTEFLRSRAGLVLLGFVAVAGFFLVTEHTAHLFGALPYLLVGGCLLMHLFMHSGHGGHSDQSTNHAGDADAYGKDDITQ
jgi:DUF2933 family protein